MKAFIFLSAFFVFISSGCNRNNDQELQQKQSHTIQRYDPEMDPNRNSLSNQPAVDE